MLPLRVLVGTDLRHGHLPLWDPYLWSGSQWVQLVTSASMPAAFIAANPSSSGQGVYEIQIAPSNSNIMYMSFDGYVFVSDNKGATWTQTAFAPVSENPNDNYAQYGQKMAVDYVEPEAKGKQTPEGLERQINIRVPDDVPAGEFPLEVNRSEPVTIRIDL